jgi:hypothetical protein
MAAASAQRTQLKPGDTVMARYWEDKQVQILSDLPTSKSFLTSVTRNSETDECSWKASV